MDYETIGLEMAERTEGVHSNDWSDSDKIRIVALLWNDFQRDPNEAFNAFTQFRMLDSTDVQDDLLRIADELDGKGE